MKFYLMIVPLFLFRVSFGQVVYADDKPGIFNPAKVPIVAGFPSYQLAQVLNRIPIITHPIGYDVKEGSVVKLDPKNNVYAGSLTVGFPRYLSINGKPLELQGEYYQAKFVINIFNPFARSPILTDIMDKIRWPQEFFTDTVPITWQLKDGVLVGKAAIGNKFTSSGFAYVINPKQTPFFVPVTKDEYMAFFIERLKIDLDKYKDLLKSTQENITSAQNDPNMKEDFRKSLIADDERNIVIWKMWIIYYQDRIKYYTSKKASLTPARQKEQAYAVLPKSFATYKDKKGITLSTITGYLDYEPASDEIDALSTLPLYHINPNFFDHKLPKTSAQLLVFYDIEGGPEHNYLNDKVREHLMPEIDWKAMRDLMYK
jgi:hypothetical protein